MPPLSNLFRAGDGADYIPRGPLHCRLVVRGEVEVALRLMLASADGSAGYESTTSREIGRLRSSPQKPVDTVVNA